MQEHDKIINKAAKKILAPHGLFQKGTSRCWIDDNGYFFIMVEFQPISLTKGSCLNVGVSFLWEASEGLNNSLVYNYGGRLYELCEYNGDNDKYQAKMESYAEMALQKVMEYRKFSDMDYAKGRLEQKISDTREEYLFWEVYELAMICFLKGDFEEGAKVFDKFLEISKDRFYVNGYHIKWKEEFYNHCIHDIKPCLISKEAAQNMVLDMINRRRMFFISKPSFKKMDKHSYFKV